MNTKTTTKLADADQAISAAFIRVFPKSTAHEILSAGAREEQFLNGSTMVVTSTDNSIGVAAVSADGVKLVDTVLTRTEMEEKSYDELYSVAFFQNTVDLANAMHRVKQLFDGIDLSESLTSIYKVNIEAIGTMFTDGDMHQNPELRPFVMTDFEEKDELLTVTAILNPLLMAEPAFGNVMKERLGEPCSMKIKFVLNLAPLAVEVN